MSKKPAKKKKSTGLLDFLFGSPQKNRNLGLHKTMDVKDPWSMSYKEGHAKAKIRREAKPGSRKSWKNSIK